MRWISFAILAALCIVCQTTLVPHMRFRGIGPDWMLVLAVFYAMWGPWPDAAIATWILGLIVDLTSAGTGGRIGLYAFCFGAAGWGIIRLRQVIFRTHPVAQAGVTFLFALAVELVAVLYRWWSTPASSLSPGWGMALTSALYTAAWAPPLHWVLLRLGRLTGLRHEGKPWAYGPR